MRLSRAEREHWQGQYYYYGASGVIDNIDDYLFDKPLLLIGEDRANLLNRNIPIAFIGEGTMRHCTRLGSMAIRQHAGIKYTR